MRPVSVLALPSVLWWRPTLSYRWLLHDDVRPSMACGLGQSRIGVNDTAACKDECEELHSRCGGFTYDALQRACHFVDPVGCTLELIPAGRAGVIQWYERLADSEPTLASSPPPTSYGRLLGNASAFDASSGSDGEVDLGFVATTTSHVSAGVASVLALLVSGRLIFQHLRHYSQPFIQKHICRVVAIVPFYAVLSVLSLIFWRQAIYFNTVRDCWESFVIYSFLVLILAYCGGENSCIVKIAVDPGSVQHAWPLNYCFPALPLNARFMRLCKQGTLQFVIQKPIMAAISLCLHAVGHFEDAWYQWILGSVYNISYTVALYVLLLFYMATRKHPGLKGKKPVLKFLSVKMVVFATYYQSLGVQFIPGVAEESLELWNDYILCLEMVPFALLHASAFRWRIFASGLASRDTLSTLSSAADVLSVRDVADDARVNFSSKYGSHVLLETDRVLELGDNDEENDTGSLEESASSKPRRRVKLKQYIFGNLSAPVPIEERPPDAARNEAGAAAASNTSSEILNRTPLDWARRAEAQRAPYLKERIHGFGDTTALHAIRAPVVSTKRGGQPPAADQSSSARQASRHLEHRNSWSEFTSHERDVGHERDVEQVETENTAPSASAGAVTPKEKEDDLLPEDEGPPKAEVRAAASLAAI